VEFGCQVKYFIGNHQLLSIGDRVLVAVSGGPDSVALLHVLCELRDEFSLHLEVAHLQHGIRGADAEDDARFVAELAKQLALPFHLRKVDLPRLKSDAGKGNLEALARRERYQFFAALVDERKLSKVATAHTQDDQAETVLMWLLRGSGMRGLGGMEPLHRMKTDGKGARGGITVIRPLLNVTKVEILDFLKAKQSAFRVDRTNRDTRLLRNWIRWELLPKLMARSGARFSARLARQAELLRDDDFVLEGLARGALERMRRPDGLDRELFLEEPPASQRRILRLWIEEARGDLLGVDFAHVAALLDLIKGDPPHARLAVPGGFELVKEYRRLRLEKHDRKLRGVSCYRYELRIGRLLHIGEAGVTVHSELISPPLVGLPESLFEAVFDVALLARPLSVRNFRRGDRFRPLGMAGHKKLKDLFIDKKIPLTVRANLPLLCAGDEILWIPGYGRSDAAKVGPETAEILRLRVVSRDYQGGL
jgi:tRNA(Ile)-lysidine synthase